MGWGAVILFSVAETLGTSSASAQSAVAIVPTTSSPDLPPSVASAVGRIAEAATAHGVPVLGSERAGTLFETQGSAAPPSVTQSDIDRWLASSRSAVRNLARADYDAARDDLLAAQQLSERAAEELNREAERARQVLDTCLFMVRSFIETQDVPRASVQARECRRLVPRVEPSRALHPPEVRDLLERVDQELSQAPPASLRVDSQPSGCTVRVNGLEMGSTPYTMRDLIPGEYRVQVECDTEQRGRVHRVRLEQGSATMRVDARFDRIVQTQPLLHLAYQDADAANRHRLEHARQVGSVLGAQELWLVSPVDVGLRIDRVTASGVLASVVLPVGDDGGLAPATATEAVEALRAAESVSLVAGRAPIARWQPPGEPAVTTHAAPADEPPVAPETGAGWGASEWLGAGLAVAGAAAYVAGWLAYGERVDRGERLAVALPEDPDYLDRQQRWLDARTPVLALPIAGALLLGAGETLLLPEADGVPWWAWASAGVGAAVAGVGLATIFSAAPCDSQSRHDQACVDEAQTVDRGALFALHSLPLLWVPASYLVRQAFGTSAPEEVAFRPVPAGGMLSVGGHL